MCLTTAKQGQLQPRTKTDNNTNNNLIKLLCTRWFNSHQANYKLHKRKEKIKITGSTRQNSN
jgi:hypothetical protein